MAASLLIAISIGYWFLRPNLKKSENPVALSKMLSPVAPPDKIATSADSVKDKDADEKGYKSPLLAQNSVPIHRHHLSRTQPVISAPENVVGSISSVNNDTVAYTASNSAFYKKSSNNAAEDLLKKMPGVEVKADITNDGKKMAKAGFDDKYAANISQTPKQQLIDSYGAQVAIRGSNKVIGADKALDTTKTLNNALAGRVAGINAQHKGELNEVVVVGYGYEQKKSVTGSVATVSARDTTGLVAPKAKLVKQIDSTMYLAEVVVPGYADKAKSPIRPADGWKSYLAYIKHEAVMPDNSVGKVMLAFKIGKDGVIYGIRILKGSTMAINQKAIEILKNGPAWVGSSINKEIKLKIKFHKGD